MEQSFFNWETPRRTFTVAELTTSLREVLTELFTDIWVSGEISGTRLPPSGHYYFTLKDETAQLKCVCYKSSARYLKFKPQDGVAVLARGRQMRDDGADLLDIGGESTRPGAASVSPDTELARVLPAVRALAAELDLPLKIGRAHVLTPVTSLSRMPSSA